MVKVITEGITIVPTVVQKWMAKGEQTMRDKQIEEMAEFLYNNRPWPELWEEDAQDIAKVLCNAGYRKKSDVAREIFEEIEDVINNIGYFDEIDFRSLKKKYLGEDINAPTKESEGDK
jgi:hypothetical protein